ncbi:MAG: [protein-PII] uridylyltransferase [Nitrospiraceae bacterium]|nr:[protein-PII] uridylyltransferase [Nitrospiraceae bacterium]
MNAGFLELTELARTGSAAFATLPRQDCVDAARAYVAREREAVRQRHAGGESGMEVVRALTEIADRVLRGVLDFGLSFTSSRNILLSRISLCALGGYGRAELSPHSDLDVCLLFDTVLGDEIKALNDYILYFLWDVGFEVCYSVRSVAESVELAADDLRAFTCVLESRLIAGDTTTFARLKLQLRELLADDAVSASYVASRSRSRYENLPGEYNDLYHVEPDIKENKGGLRDFHTGLWLLMMTYGPLTIDDVESLGIITPDEHLAVVKALNFIWRIRNELHFNSEREENVLTLDNQRHVAQALGYGNEEGEGVVHFMQDYYAAARMMRRLLRIATQACNQYRNPVRPLDTSWLPPRFQIVVKNGQIAMGHNDSHWFEEQPSRLMEVFWECARHKAPLSRAVERAVGESLDLVNGTFRSSDLVRRYFVAICSRPMAAGFAMRQAAQAGLLGRYLPEFEDIRGIICYEDFHHFPVGEHTLRALEALSELPGMQGPVSECLHAALEHLPDPYILVLSVLLHDFGKVNGEMHVDKGVEIAERICNRIGMPTEDTERIAFAIKHHVEMTLISQYRDIDDIDIVRDFAKTMKTEERLRTLFLFSYADLAAVGPGVWTDWKGALLMKLYLRAERVLLGRVEAADAEFWRSPKAERVCAAANGHSRAQIEEHLRGLGERYLMAFPPEEIAAHLAAVEEVRKSGLVVRCTAREDMNMTEVMVCTRDRQGLFSKIAGSFASKLIDVNGAALFTRPDGWVVDCFTVSDASQGRPLTSKECARVERVLRAVLIDNEDVQERVDRSRRRLFALLQPRVAARTRIQFDNKSSRTHTVVDVETGDRTGLLYDITRAMADAGLGIATARIVTDARRVRDSFYVTADGKKLEDEETQARVREIMHSAIHPRTLADSRGGIS